MATKKTTIQLKEIIWTDHTPRYYFKDPKTGAAYISKSEERARQKIQEIETGNKTLLNVLQFD